MISSQKHGAVWAYRAGSDVKIHADDGHGNALCGVRIRPDWKERGEDYVDCTRCLRVLRSRGYSIWADTPERKER